MTLEIGEKIRHLRLQRGMTQGQLGEALGLSAQAVSKWESQTNMPDIQLLPELSVLLGVSIDELFSMTDSSRMDRIENMIETVRFLPESDFCSAEKFLKEKLTDKAARPRAALILAELYVKRAREYDALAAPLARQALLLNPDEKAAHSAVFDAEHGPYPDWNAANFVELIDFYRDFLRKHPENPRTYLWLLDLLIAVGRTGEAKEVLSAMDKVEHSYRTALYEGLIAKAERDLPRALSCWQQMTDEFPGDWLSWFSRADAMARLCRYDEALAYYEKALSLQPSPKFTDSPEAMAQIFEIQGDYDRAIHMRERCIDLLRTDWALTEGEPVDEHRRAISRLREKKAGT